MGNSCVITSDKKSVYLSIRADASLNKRIFLLASNIAMVSVILFLVFSAEPQEKGFALILIVVLLLLSSIQLMRFTLWNFVGKEVLIVNRKSITTQMDYGLFILSPLSIPCQEWMIAYEKTSTTPAGVFGKIVVHNYSNDGLAMSIHETTTRMRTKDAEIFLEKLQRMVDDEDRRFPIIMENLRFPRLMDN